jgi:hypothetical protein
LSTLPSLAVADLYHLLVTGRAGEELGVAVGVPAVRLTGEGTGNGISLDQWAPKLASLPCVLAADADADHLAPVADVLCDDTTWSAVAAQIEATPLAAVAMALLLRQSEERSIDAGLVAESTTYSMLQSGPEFAAWRAGRPRAERPDSDEVVLLDRLGDTLVVTFNRPHVHNAWSARMRDASCEALLVALADDSIERVELRGAGKSFCSGGDLDEFGSFPDPVTGHTVRLARSPGRLVSRLGSKVVSYLHGSCVGAGIELPSFGGRLVAAPDTVVVLPELTLGLVPGAGGTVSLPRRIGRHRTALLALAGLRLDAATALEWGVVDEIAPA